MEYFIKIVKIYDDINYFIIVFICMYLSILEYMWVFLWFKLI